MSIQEKLDENERLLQEWSQILDDATDWESTEKRLVDTQCKKKLHSNLTVLAKILEKQYAKYKEKKKQEAQEDSDSNGLSSNMELQEGGDRNGSSLKIDDKDINESQSILGKRSSPEKQDCSLAN